VSEELYQIPDQRPLWKQIHDVLEDLIVHRALDPGTHLGEVELAEKFGVSRGPVREAIRMLQNEEWVIVHDRQGAYVRTPDPQEVEQLFEVRICLDIKAAALACERATDAELDELAEIYTKGIKSRDNGDMNALVDLNTDFHRTLAKLSGNKVLYEITENIERKVIWHLSAVMASRAKDGWEEHHEIIVALNARDAQKCADILTKHSSDSLNAYIDWSGTQEEPA
jgi:DNA-binding GntR family transcriptional regulator